jgi:Bacterial regulatory proteins, luxR family
MSTLSNRGRRHRVIGAHAQYCEHRLLNSNALPLPKSSYDFTKRHIKARGSRRPLATSGSAGEPRTITSSPRMRSRAASGWQPESLNPNPSQISDEHVQTTIGRFGLTGHRDSRSGRVLRRGMPGRSTAEHFDGHDHDRLRDCAAGKGGGYSRSSRRSQLFRIFRLIPFEPKRPAERGFISPRTVEIHRVHIMKKLVAKNTADLVRIVLSKGRRT